MQEPWFFYIDGGETVSDLEKKVIRALNNYTRNVLGEKSVTYDSCRIWKCFNKKWSYISRLDQEFTSSNDSAIKGVILNNPNDGHYKLYGVSVDNKDLLAI